MNAAFEMCTPELARLITRVLVILSAVSAYFTYRGAVLVLDEAGVSWDNRMAAAAFAIAVWAMIYLLWYLALRIIPGAGRYRLPGLAIVVFICLLLAGMSTWLGAAGLAGTAAETLDLWHRMARAEATVANSYEGVRRIEALTPALERAAKSYRRLARQERDHGKLTGHPGRGTVEQSLDLIAADLDDVNAAIARFLEGAKGRAAEAREKLEAMRQAIARDETPALRVRAFARHADGLRAILVEMGGQSLALSVRQALEALPSGFAVLPVSQRSKSLAKDQRRAIEQLRADIAGTAATLGALAAEIAAAPQESLANDPPLGPTAAIFRYAADFWPYWAGSAGLDFSVVGVLLFLMLALVVQEQAGGVPPEVDNLTVRQIRIAKAAEMVARMPASLPSPQRPETGGADTTRQGPSS